MRHWKYSLILGQELPPLELPPPPRPRPPSITTFSRWTDLDVTALVCSTMHNRHRRLPRSHEGPTKTNVTRSGNICSSIHDLLLEREREKIGASIFLIGQFLLEENF